MPDWTLIETHPTKGRTFRRPLDAGERAFFWNGCFNGTTDTLNHVELRLPNASRDAHLYSEANIIKAWLSTKRRFPLVGVTVHLPPDDNSVPSSAPEPYFVAREHDLALLRPQEIIFGQVACAEEMPQRKAAILDGPRPLSNELLARLYVFRETDSQRTDVFHLMIVTAHCVTDAMANRTLMRVFLDTLARSGDPDWEPAQMPLEERLGMAIPSVEFEPVHLRSLNPARRRWRLAIAAVLLQFQERKQGGHTLPCRLTRMTPLVPARSGLVSTLLTEEQTNIVISNCRLYKVTFGNAFLALAQVAMTRVLYRRYLRGEISEEEWEYRKRQPHRSSGPVNLRPYLDKPWFERGGGGEFVPSLHYFSYTLPFMTLGITDGRQYDERDLSDGAPPFSDLLTFDRFLHRAGLVEKQTKAFFAHPLFFDFIHVSGPVYAHAMHLRNLDWIKHGETAKGTGIHAKDAEEEVIAVTDMGTVSAYTGSSFGKIQLLFPAEYPIPPTHPLSPYSSVPHPVKAGYVVPPPTVPTTEEATTPRIVVEDASTELHSRPAELYLRASTWGGRLSIHVFYDGNVYEDGVVKEWLDEVSGAVLWYLGRTHARCDQGNRVHGGPSV